MRIVALANSGRCSRLRSSIVAAAALFGAAFGAMPPDETVRAPPYCPDHLHPAGRFDAKGWCDAEPLFNGTMIRIDRRAALLV